MRALVLASPGAIELRDVPEPRGGCRIRVTLAGICGTDLQLIDGYAEFRGIPGHEFVGVVDRVSRPEDRAWLGRRVVGEINIGCGICAWCAAGVKEHCPDRRVLGIRGHDGAFAEYVTLPAANLHAIPDEIDDRTAVFVEPVAAACRIFEQVEIGDRTTIAVLGDGRLGLLIAQVLRTRSSQVVLFGRHAAKLAIARSLGLSCVDTSGDRHSSDHGSHRPPPTAHSYDVVVDATGRAAGFTRALDLVRPRGTVVLKSTFHGEAAVATWPAVVNEVTMVGSRCGPFVRAIELLASGAVQTAPLVSATMRLAEHAAAFAAAKTSLKILVSPQG